MKQENKTALTAPTASRLLQRAAVRPAQGKEHKRQIHTRYPKKKCAPAAPNAAASYQAAEPIRDMENNPITAPDINDQIW